jgi:hypothetical protein
MNNEAPVIFRVQDKDGRGPWKIGFTDTWMEDRPTEEYFALYRMEFAHRLRDDMYRGYGCRTTHQLRRWFTPTEYAKLQGFGYCAVKMDVNRILDETDVQCMFERSKPLSEDIEPLDLYTSA